MFSNTGKERVPTFMMTKGCLLLHGFTGCRHDLEPLRRLLLRLGYQVSAPVLKGHEADAAALGKSCRQDWLACAQAALDELRGRCEKVVVVGFSMGGLLAANLCRHNEVDGIVFINTPVYYWGLGRVFRDLCRNFRGSVRRYGGALKGTPFHALWEFQMLLSGTKPVFRTIQCRSLVLQSVHDDVVDPKSAEYIFTRLQGDKEMNEIAQGDHVALLGAGSAQTCTFVRKFLVSF